MKSQYFKKIVRAFSVMVVIYAGLIAFFLCISAKSTE